MSTDAPFDGDGTPSSRPLKPLTVFASMAPRAWLLEAETIRQSASAYPLVLETAGGVDVERRVAAGQVDCDVVILAMEALERLSSAGHLLERSTVPIARSETVVAVPAGRDVPALNSAADLLMLLRRANRIAYSSGPSGTAFRELLRRLQVDVELEQRLVQAQPGRPVAEMLAEEEANVGVQQRSEMLNVRGAVVVGALPADIAITTDFGAGIHRSSSRTRDAANFVAFLRAPAFHDVLRRYGMEPVLADATTEPPR